MLELTRGGNVGLAAAKATVLLEWNPATIQGSEVDVSAFLLAASGKVRTDNDFVFYGATASPCESVLLVPSATSTRFEIDLGKVPADIERIAFTATLTGGARFGAAQSLKLTVVGCATFAVPTGGMTEAAIIVGELYKRNGAWKVRAVGQGFDGGLGPLATHFGVDVGDDAPAPVPPPAPAPPKLNLSKITLEKSGQSARISLEKTSGEIAINLNWPSGTGVDLDLGVFYELRDGTKSLIDGVQFSQGRGGPRDRQTRQGCFAASPWVWHQGDDRTGGVASGESVYINPKGIPSLRRVILYAFIFEGAPNWSTTAAVVTVKVPGQEIVIEMGRQTDQRGFCALAQLEFSGEHDVNVTKLVTFHSGHRDCDSTYKWGFSYSAGTK